MQALTGNKASLDLEEAVAQAAQLQPIEVPREIQEGVLEFILRRLEQLLVDEGCGVEAVKAVLSERGANPSIIAQSARELQVRCVCCKQPTHHSSEGGALCSEARSWGVLTAQRSSHQNRAGSLESRDAQSALVRKSWLAPSLAKGRVMKV